MDIATPPVVLTSFRALLPAMSSAQLSVIQREVRGWLAAIAEMAAF
jgi:hypothetical protein